MLCECIIGKKQISLLRTTLSNTDKKILKSKSVRLTVINLTLFVVNVDVYNSEPNSTCRGPTRWTSLRFE